ncbi:MAG: hypothetical protein U5S82_19900 [Gammaproteobacteria bacterium]|nr:hypothetical protein [Gammaproteobacteria bacterium]
MNDWEADPDGESYRQRISGAGQPDLQRWVERDLYPRVLGVNETFSKKYGWGDPGRLRFSRRGEPGDPRRDAPASLGRDAGASLRLDREGRVPLTHWGKQEGLTALDPNYWGTAAAGQERSRAGPGFKPRTYYGLPGYRVESVVSARAKNRYFTTLNPASLYDHGGDPDALAALVLMLVGREGECIHQVRKFLVFHGTPSVVG